MLIELRKKIKFNSLRGERSIKGQIFPFLVLIMVIMIIAVMAFVNVAQVNTQKLATMNAADAGALAAAAQLASTANYIADQNSGPDGLYDKFRDQLWRYLVRPLDPASVLRRSFQYEKLAVENLVTYLELLYSGLVAAQQSAAQATTTAFGNIPVEEAQARIGSVTGEAKTPSRFSKWMRDTNFYSKDIEQTYRYPWYSHYYNITTDKQMARQKEDYVSVKVRKPKDNCFVLIPSPPLPQPTMYMMWIPPCVEPVSCGICAVVKFLVKSARWILKRFPITVATTLGLHLTASAILNILAEMPVQAIADLLLAASLTINSLRVLLKPINTGAEVCGSFVTSTVFYFVPIPFILKMADDKPEIAVEVTRFSPTRDLGLWQFKQRKITSGARARIYGGSVWSPKYKIEVRNVWDGEQL